MKESILVIGSSGTVGAEIVRLLRQNGKKVLRATSRKNDVVPGDSVYLNLATKEGLRGALQGASHVFMMSPPGFSDQYALLSPLIAEAARSGVQKAVLMTAMGANANPESPFRRAEIELEKSGMEYNIIRPNWFFQNFHTFWIQGILKKNKILLPAGKAKVGFIDARDIAEVAVRLLLTSDLAGQSFDLTGPAAIDHHQVANAISSVVGKSITYEEIPVETFREGLVGAGVPVDYADFLVLIMGFLREGYSAGVTNGVQKVLGRAPRDVQDYVNTYKQNWK